MSAADREEGLVPYSPSLGAINPLTIVSHRHHIARPRKVWRRRCPEVGGANVLGIGNDGVEAVPCECVGQSR
eukprot:6197805-Pleurochrysis_carterae.AAC.3